MGLDWSKEISFSGLRKKAARKPKDEYPSKRYMNMMVADAQEQSVRRVSLLTVPLVILLVLFAKFGVYEPYHRVYLKTQEFSKLTEEYTRLETELANYNEVLEEYRMYDAIRMTNDAEDVAVVDALALVDQFVSGVGRIDSVVLDNDVLTLQLTDTSLDKVGNLVSTLYEQPMVTGVQVSTAGNKNTDKETRVIMTISLRSLAAAEAEATSASTESQSSEG